tara:strand:- start:644 stop:1372 length:729 start_codon:yes stop_codon:yes gene_type:complete
MKNNLNVAFCFFGQTRIVDTLNVYYKKIEKDYDFFMSTWDDEDSANIDFEFVKCNKHNFDIEKGKLQSIVPFQCFDKESKELQRINKNISAQYIIFHINDVITSVRKYEKENDFKYDAIIICRPDHLVDLDILKVEIDRFLKQCDLDVPLISTQTPLYINDYSFTIDDDALFFFNNNALDYVLNLKTDLFEKRKDFDIKFSYRGPHEMFPFAIVQNNFVSVTNGIKTHIIRTQESFDEKYKK